MAAFPIGTPGTPWGEAERVEWRGTRQVQRSYKEEVVDKIQQLDATIYEAGGAVWGAGAGSGALYNS